MTDQPLASTTVAQPIAIGTLAEANGITVENADEITFEYEGTYSLTFSAQITNLANSVQKAIFWVKKNGVDYPDSATEIDLQPRKTSSDPNRQVITINYVATAEAGDYVQVFWAGDSTQLKVESLPGGTSPVYPAVPSIILTAVQVMYTQLGPQGEPGESGIVISEEPPASTDVLWLDSNDTSFAPVPSGVISQFAGATAPAGYLLCIGQSLSTTQYADLFNVIGYNYGGSGSSFSVPNLQNRIPVGRGSGTFANLNATGGSETHTLTIAQMPSHTHTQNSHNHSQDSHNHSQNAHAHAIPANGNGYVTNGVGNFDNAYIVTGGSGYSVSTPTPTTATNNATTATNQATTATNQNTGGGEPHNNLQPYIVVNYIIKT
jgi:microcystin-dependent protein